MTGLPAHGSRSPVLPIRPFLMRYVIQEFVSERAIARHRMTKVAGLAHQHERRHLDLRKITGEIIASDDRHRRRERLDREVPAERLGLAPCELAVLRGEDSPTRRRSSSSARRAPRSRRLADLREPVTERASRWHDRDTWLTKRSVSTAMPRSRSRAASTRGGSRARSGGREDRRCARTTAQVSHRRLRAVAALGGGAGMMSRPQPAPESRGTD